MLYIPIGLYLALFIYAWFFSDSAIFLPHPSSYRDDSKILKITTRSGRRISAIYLPNAEARYTLLVSHGNAEDRGRLGGPHSDGGRRLVDRGLDGC